MDGASIVSAILTAIIFAAIVWFVRSTTTSSIQAIADSAGATETRRALIGPVVTGKWRGYDARWFYRGRIGTHRSIAWIAASAPTRLSIRPRGAFPSVAIGGPPRVEIPAFPEMVIRSDDSVFAQHLLDDAAVREAMEAALTDNTDSLEIDPTGVRVTRTVGDMDDRPIALMKAWTLAAAVVERFGFPTTRP